MPLITFAKRSILGVWQGFEYASDTCEKDCLVPTEASPLVK